MPPTLAPLPAWEEDLPAECPPNGAPVRLDAVVDGAPVILLFVPCQGPDRTAGPLIYADGRLVGTGRVEHAVVAQAGAGSLTGAQGEYWVAWTSGDGVESWLVVYRIVDGASVGIWNSVKESLPRWVLATYRYQTLGGPRGSIEILSSDPDHRRCRTCPGQRYREVYEWVGQGMVRTYRQPA